MYINIFPPHLPEYHLDDQSHLLTKICYTVPSTNSLYRIIFIQMYPKDAV